MRPTGYHIYISIMNQYTPLPQVADIEALNRTVTPEEYDRVLRFAERIGIEQGFRQEGSAACESFIPEFDERGTVILSQFHCDQIISEIPFPCRFSGSFKTFKAKHSGYLFFLFHKNYPGLLCNISLPQRLPDALIINVCNYNSHATKNCCGSSDSNAPATQRNPPDPRKEILWHPGRDGCGGRYCLIAPIWCLSCGECVPWQFFFELRASDPTDHFFVFATTVSATFSVCSRACLPCSCTRSRCISLFWASCCSVCIGRFACSGWFPPCPCPFDFPPP